MLFKDKLKKTEKADQQEKEPLLEEAYKILIVDDEEEVHKVTKLFFKNFEYLGRGLDFISAYSAKEAIEILKVRDDISVILLDVVMEDDKAGLRVVETIRNEIKNDFVRIILRTGQPGIMLPNELAEKYQINDYKIKSELTQEKLSATLITALRAFDEIRLMESARSELEEKVKERTKELEELNKNLEIRVEKEVAARVKSEEEKIKQQEALIQQSKLASMGEMMGAIMHQWAQPLTSVSLMAQLMLEMQKRMEDSKEEFARLAKEIINNVSFMSETMGDFKNFFKPNKTKHYFYIEDEIHSVYKMMIPQLKRCDIKVEIDCEKNTEAYGYPNEFKQVVLNILNNAKDVIIEKRMGEGSIWVRGKKDSSKVVIELEDSGGGISDDMLERVFENYVSSKGDNGTGIGLYMSKIMIEDNMQGKISVINSEYGAKFIIELPSSEK